MTKITIRHFDRHAGRTFQEAALAALKDVADEFGVSIEAKRFTHADSELDITFTAKVMGEDGKPAVSVQFQSALDRFNLDPDKIGSERGYSYRLVGYSPSRPKYPWDIKRVGDDRSFKAPHAMVVRLFTRTTPIIPSATSAPTPGPTRPSAGRYTPEF